METTFAVSCQSSDSVPSRLKDEAKMIQARVTGKVETRSKRRSRACWKDVAEPERWCLDGGAVYVGKTWRSRKGGAWLVEPCMLGTDTCGSGAAKVRLRWRSRAGWKDVAEPERWCLDGGAVSVGDSRWGRAGKPLDECEKQNQNQPKKIHGRQKEAKTVGTNVCGSKTLVARKKTKVWKL
jgi:hypothetical protein